MNILVNDKGKLVSKGLDYTNVGDAWTGAHPVSGIDLFFVDAPNLTVVSVPDDTKIAVGITRYVDGEFFMSPSSPLPKYIRTLLNKYPEKKGESIDTILSWLNETKDGAPTSLVKFFEKAIKAGASPGDFSDLWKYDGYRQTVEEAHLEGSTYRLRALIMTKPISVSPHDTSGPRGR